MISNQVLLVGAVVLLLGAFLVYMGFYKKPDIEILESQTAKERFASEVLLGLQKIEPDTVYEYNPARDLILARDQFTKANEDALGTHKIYLQNIFNRTKDMNAVQRAEYIDQFLSESSNQSAQNKTQFIETLGLRIRTKSELTTRRLYLDSVKSDPQDPIVQNSGELLLELISDSDVSIKVVGQSELDNIDISEQTALALAKANLINSSPKQVWEKYAENIWVSRAIDDYDGVRLIAGYPDMSLPFEQAPIVYMPSHAVCLISNSDAPDVLEQMIEAGDDMAQNHRLASVSLWYYSIDGWEQWIPDHDHRAYKVARIQSIKAQLLSYDEQKQMLDEIFDQSGIDIFVASLLAYEDLESGVYTMSTYSSNVATILPKSDRVAIGEIKDDEEDSKIAIVSWDEFIQLMGGKDLPTFKDYNPTRYDLSGKLSPEQLSALRKKLTKQ